jgi:hypothetical protein
MSWDIYPVEAVYKSNSLILILNVAFWLTNIPQSSINLSIPNSTFSSPHNSRWGICFQQKEGWFYRLHRSLLLPFDHHNSNSTHSIRLHPEPESHIYPPTLLTASLYSHLALSKANKRCSSASSSKPKNVRHKGNGQNSGEQKRIQQFGFRDLEK